MARQLLPVLVLVLALPLLAGCLSSRTREEVTAVLEAQQAAWNAGDVEGFMAAGYWKSGELTFLSGGDWTRGYGEVLERYRRRYVEGDAQMGRLTFSDLEVEALGRDHALARGRWALELGEGEGPAGLFTLILRRVGGHWRIVHDHTSAASD